MNIFFLSSSINIAGCGIAFAAGLIFFLFGLVYIFSRKRKREEHFAAAAIFEFLASWILFIPEELVNDIPESSPVLRVIEGICTALLRTFNIYLGNGYDRGGFEGYPVFSSLYSILVVVINIFLLLLVVGFIAKFLDGPLQRVKLSFRKKRYSYVFASANEKSLVIAESIDRKKNNIIFANCRKDLEESIKQRILSISGLLTDMSLKETVMKLVSKSEGIEVFVFSDKEQDNLVELETLNDIIERIVGGKEECKDDSILINGLLRIYVELYDTPWNLYDEYLKRLNSRVGEKVIINFVRTEENFVYNNLLKNSIFENAISGNNYNSIKFLLVGMNERNLEMFKAVLPLGQMPEYRMTVMVIDEGKNREKLKQKFPEIEDKCENVGNALYEIIYHELVDLDTNCFEDIITEEYDDFTFAFINVEDDLRNVNIAMRLRAACYRKNRRSGYKIQASVRNRDISRSWRKELLDNINLIGADKDIYAYNFITMSDIEKIAIKIHELRHSEDKETWSSYCNNEYNRHSVYARALSLKYKIWVIDKYFKGNYDLTKTNNNWIKYEHMRWDMYTRTLGSVMASDSLMKDKALFNSKGRLDKTIRDIAKVHDTLTDFDKLPEEIQNQDKIDIDDNIVNILKGEK